LLKIIDLPEGYMIYPSGVISPLKGLTYFLARVIMFPIEMGGLDMKCPSIESSEFLCDREAFYQIDGIVYCQIHARRIMTRIEKFEAQLNRNLYELKVDAPVCADSKFYHVNQGLEV